MYLGVFEQKDPQAEAEYHLIVEKHDILRSN